MKTFVKFFSSIIFIINCILGYLAGSGRIPEGLFFGVLSGSFVMCAIFLFIGYVFSSDGNY